MKSYKKTFSIHSLLFLLILSSCVKADLPPYSTGSNQGMLLFLLFSAQPPLPLVRLRFNNGSLADSGTAGVSLTPSGAPTTTTGKDGDANGAYNFNGSSQYMDTPVGEDSGFPMGASPRTMCAWVKPAVSPVTQFIFMRYGSPYTNTQSSLLGYVNASSVLKVFISDQGDNAYLAYTLPLNTWTHICSTFDGVSANYYANGNFIGAKIPTNSLGPFNTTSGSLMIGALAGAGSYNWNGAIDDVRIYGTDLNALQISLVYGDKDYR
jgi:hypothetical protein